MYDLPGKIIFIVYSSEALAFYVIDIKSHSKYSNQNRGAWTKLAQLMKISNISHSNQVFILSTFIFTL